MEYNIGQEEEVSVSVMAGNRDYYVRFYTFRDLTYCDISYGDNIVVAGKRVMANQWLLPLYMTGEGGNFRFETYEADKDEYVHHSGFDSKFRFCSYSAEEIDEMEKPKEA